MPDREPPIDAEQLRNHLAAIVASSDDAIISKTLDGIIISWNEGAQRIFGYTADEAIGKPITLLIPPDHLDEEPGILARIRRGERIEHYQTVRMRKDGSLVNISLSVSPVRNARGEVVAASKIARDITELRQALAERDELLQAERAARSTAERLGHLKDEFLATLSHELRTPLNAILGWASLLRKLGPGSTDYLRGLDTIERNARVQSQIVSDLLDMSRIISGKVQLDVQALDLPGVISAALDSVRPAMVAKKIRVRTLLDRRCREIRGDPNRLQQVFWNLLTNAVKFTPAEGRIDVLLEQVDSHVEVTVADSGVGIKPEFIDFVFDRFRQADATASRRHGGLGLGLSIVKHLVEQHGGSVRVRSAGAGQGATFVVALPVAVTHAKKSQSYRQAAYVPHDPTAVELPSLAGIRALVLDDQDDSRILIGRLITESGGVAVAARSAEEALRVLESGTVDVIVSDIGMPDIDGYEFMRRVRMHEPSQNIMAIALTAYARSEDRQRALLAGYQMHLAKPVESRELIAGIASLLNLHTRSSGKTRPRRRTVPAVKPPRAK